ncbi:galactokinase [Robertkochia marina]|uniref:Galactokinase n=1 Tax=Robertkochia marina TaxID=1227945 RepID=A0A4S3LY30_9FLAO|nr:galactokinase family protein [Robertkochia marina]THD66478.1 galactokinase [Robertkochia marina]TRZ44156.1 galactokinase [Robertkochia marina]
MSSKTEHPSKKGEIEIIAPARTCLFGDHQDYLGLPVIACAIDRHIRLTATPIEEELLRIFLPDIGESTEIPLNANFKNGVQGNHLLSAFKVIKDEGANPEQGYEITINGNVAINAGISSSSAVMVAWIAFLRTVYLPQLPFNKEHIAQLAYKAEVIEQNSPGGKMDQYSISLGQIMYLETDDKNHHELFNRDMPGLIVSESGIPKSTLGVLGDLRGKAWQAINEVTHHLPGFQIAKTIGEDPQKYLPFVSPELKNVFTAAMENYRITKAALREMKTPEPNLSRIGELMNEHHEVLRDLLKITVPKIDHMINAAQAHGALGAKIVGSGMGGSIVVLAREEDRDQIIDALKNSGARDAYPVKVDPGVRITQNTLS